MTSTESISLSNWVRSFAQTNYHLFVPSEEQLLQAIKDCFPSQLSESQTDRNVQELLEQILGIVTIIKLGNEQIALSIATNTSEAEVWQQTYNAPLYSRVRHELGVDAHWILLVDPEFLFTLQDLYEGHMDVMELEDRPECVIVPV